MVTKKTRSDLEDKFERDGFILVREVLTKQEVRSLREFLIAALERHEAITNLHTGIQTGTTSCRAIWPYFYQTNPDWFGIFCNARIVEPLHRLLGDPFVLTRDSIAHWGYFPDWHTDTTTSEVAGKLLHRDPDWRMLTVGIYLQSSGGLCVVPGSQRASDPFVEMRKNRGATGLPVDPAQWSSPTALDISTEPGDAVVFDMRLIHRASKTASMTSAAESCQKLAVFSRVSRNIPAHVADYSDFQFNGASVGESNLPKLRERARQYGFLVT
jgi:hypothetical protein